MTFRHFLALEVAALVASSSALGRPTVLGVVEEAHRVHLNNGVVSPGATVYDGDRFSTESGGMLLLRGDAAILELGEEGEVVVRRSANVGQGTAAELDKGTLIFSAARAVAVAVVALGARVIPGAGSRTVGQVSVTGPKELFICARCGVLQFSYGGERETIAQGAACRVILDPAEDGLGKTKPVKAVRHRNTLLFVATTGGAAAATTVILYENHKHKRIESPDRP
jgi:hypothetical protein